MEGLTGTAIRLAVRDPSCPQGPGPGWSSAAPVSVRSPSCGWLRPRPPIPASAPDSQEPVRRVADGAAIDGASRRQAPDLIMRIKSRPTVRVTRRQPYQPAALHRRILVLSPGQASIWKAGPAVLVEGLE